MSLLSLLKKKCDKTLFTTPSHAGKLFIVPKFRGFYKYDISETDTYNPIDELEKAQTKVAKLYDVKQTLFLTNGSSSGIIASVLACCVKNDKVLIWKEAHCCHKNAVDLAGCEAVYYELPMIEGWGIPDKLSPEILENILENTKIKAIIVTSPTYQGVVSDIVKLKKVCEKYGTYLIVDEAHGALYPFSDKLPTSAVKIADFTVQSLHKTAGGLNPTALLHTNTNLDVKSSLAKINTTSPSYPMLASIETNVRFLFSVRGKKVLNRLLDELQQILNEKSALDIFAPDITKINIKKNGLSGEELSNILYEKFRIEDEKTSLQSTMLLCGIGTDRLKMKKLENLVKNL